MNHLILAINELDKMFYNHETRFEDPLIKQVNNSLENLIKAQEIIEKMNVLGNIEYSMNMHANHYKPRYLSKAQKELFEKSQSVLEKYRGQIVSTLDGYEELACYLNDAIGETMESKSFEFPKENYENKLAALNGELKRLFLSLKESSESFTNSLLEEKWLLRSFPYNSEVPKALSKDEIYLLVERYDGFIKTYVPYGGSGGIPDYLCVFHSDFDEFNFYRSLYTDMSEAEIREML